METTMARTLPPDVNPESLCRLSPLRRENLSEEGKATFDVMSKRPIGGKNLAGLQGPGGVWIRMPRFGKLQGEGNRYLRNEANLPPPLTEVIILATAREMNSQFEWTMHEPVARQEKVPDTVIDAIKFRKPTSALPETEAAVIELAREAVGRRKVSSETYARALKLFGEKQLLDIVALMASYAMTAIVLSVFDQQLHDGQQPLLPE
jgi:4-carboxymuconolactone decarboxylase